MKRILLALSFVLPMAIAVHADNRQTLESNEAAMKAGRTQIGYKTTELETRLKNHDIPAAQSTATNLLDLMRQGMDLTRTKINLQSGDPKKQKMTNDHFLKMEKLTHDSRLASQDLVNNGDELVGYAKSFVKEY